MPTLLGKANDRHAHHLSRALWHALEAALSLWRPGDGLARHRIGRRRVGGLTQPDMARRQAQQVLGIAADVEIGIGMDAGLADQQQAGANDIEIFADRLVGLAVKQLAGQFSVLVLGHACRDVEMRLVDLGDAVIDDFLVQRLLFLKTEGLACLLGEHPGDLVEGDIVEIGVVGGDRMHRCTELAAHAQGGLEGCEGAWRAVECDHQRTVADGAPGIADDQRVDIATPHHAFANRADDSARYGSQPQRAECHKIEISAVGSLDNAPVILAFGAEAAIGDLGRGAGPSGTVVIAVADHV